MTVEKRREELRKMNYTAEQRHAKRKAAPVFSDTVRPLPKGSDPISTPLRAQLNKGLMVRWINADLLTRAGHDVRKSIVFYDDMQTFETALTQADWEALGDKRETFLEMLAARTPVRYWSKGVK